MVVHADPDDSILTVKRRHEGSVLALPGVMEARVGPVVKNGRRTGEIGIIVYVDKKRPLEQIDPSGVVPASLEGYRVDVQQTGQKPLSTDWRSEVQIYGERIWRHKLILFIVLLAVLIYELLAIYGPIGPHVGDLPSFFTRDHNVEEPLSGAPMVGCIELIVTFARVFDDESGAIISDASWRSETRKGTVLAQLEEGHNIQYVIATNTQLREVALKEGWSPGEVHQITITADKRGYQKVELDLEFSTGRCGDMVETRGYTDIRLVRDDAATPR